MRRRILLGVIMTGRRNSVFPCASIRAEHWTGSLVRRNARALFLFLISLLVFCNASSKTHPQSTSSGVHAKWTIELKKYGWTPAKSESDKKFFKDFTLAKLEGLDQNTRVLFISNDELVVYHTKQEGENYRTASREVEAFFVNAQDGSLLQTKLWPVQMRKSEIDLRDSEARLVPLQGDRFLILANGTIMTYDRDLNLINQETLEPSSSTGPWSVQAVAGGAQVFLRHEPGPAVTYEWRASDTLQLLRKTPGYRDPHFHPQYLVSAGENAVFTGSSSGIKMITPDQQLKTICEDKFCRGDGHLQVFASRYIVFSGRTGIGVIDIAHGLVWSKTIGTNLNPNDVQFGHIVSSISGTRFGVWMTSYRKTLFDGVKVHQSPVLLIYDATNPKLLCSIPMKLYGDFNFALSPDEKHVAIFNDASLTLYALD
jgi:hypothetical protein